MDNSAKKIVMTVMIAALLAVICFCMLYHDNDGNNDPDVDIVGDWYLVDSISYDENERQYNKINKNMNMSIKGIAGSGNLFYGTVQTNDRFENGTEFTGAFIEKNIIFQYETEYGHIKAIGFTDNGNLVVKEIHYYDNIAAPTWFVAVNTYSKTKDCSVDGTIKTPNINLSWSAWRGTSMNNTGEYELAGEKFYIHEQNGSFFRAEMQQTVGTDIITKVLNGVFVNSYDIDGTTMYMAYIVDETGMTWNMYVRDDALILRCTTVSELSEIEGQPVVVERIYRNSSIVGPPGNLSSTSEILGKWNVSKHTVLYGDGEETNVAVERTIEYDYKNDDNGTLFSGVGTYNGIEGQELAYSVVNKTIKSGHMYHIICEYGIDNPDSLDAISYGYEWLSDEGKTLHRITFWCDSKGNGVTYNEFTKE